jgi:TonB-linked SusC/RagA family outer membrane protein
MRHFDVGYVRRRVLTLTCLVAGALLVTAPAAAQAQAATGTITGRVYDSTLAVVIGGVNIQVTGTRLTGVTGSDGRYRITNVPVGARTITALRLGYASSRHTVTVTAEGETVLDIAMEMSAVSLDQVISTGTAGETELRAIGNVVSTVDVSADLQKTAAPDMTDLLRARAPGVNIQPISGRIGAGGAIQIRSPSSIGLSNSPLIYIDGVRVNNATSEGPTGVSGGLGAQGNSVENRLDDINPDDIESIQIIKGPAASTIYGTEAANGVIQIITKKGASDQAVVTARMTMGSMFFQNAAGRVPTNYDKDPSGNIVAWNGVTAQADSGTPLFRTGLERHYDVSISGGHDQTRYYASENYENDYGIEPNNLQRMFNAHLNLTTAIGPSTDVSTSLNFVDMSTHLGADVGSSALLGAVAGHSLLFPAAQGFYPGFPPAVAQTLYDNASGVNRFTGGLTVNNQATSWFTQRAVFGLDYTGEDQRAIELYAPPALAAFLPASYAHGRIGQTLNRTSMITASYNGTAKAQVTPAIALSTSVGGQFNNTELNSSFLGGSGFPAQGVTTVSAAASQVAATQTQTINTTIGGYGQEQFAWRDRLFVVGAVRVDNNSAFGQQFKWVTYPKASASWVMSDEPFWRRWDGTINTFRLRAAYGAAGRQPNAFSALQTYTPVTGPGGSSAITAGTLGNADLRPERGVESEYGFEAELYHRLTFDFTYYNKRTTNEIVSQPVAPSTGFPGSQLVNLGTVVDHGIELQATYDAVSRSNVSWSIVGNMSTTSDLIKSNIPTSVSNAGQYNIVGYPIQGLWARRVVSADRDATTGQATNVLCDGGANAAPVACASAPFVYIGTPTPKLTASLGNTVTLGKSLSIWVLFDAKAGNKIWNESEEIRCLGLAGAPLCRANYFPLEYSTQYLAETALAKGIGNAAAVGDVNQYMEDASFVKLREVSITYTIPRQILRFSRPASITLAGRNLATWTKYRGIDPESTTGSATGAIDQAVIPPLTSFLLTFNLAW